MPSVHSKYSPSSANRWLTCPGSLDEVEVQEGCDTSEFAAEGTVAHSLCEECWILGVPPHDYVGEKRTEDGHEIEITTEMADAVQIYLDVIESATANHIGFPEIRIEHPVLDGFGGTIDFVVPKAGKIVDFKYGAGVVVEVEGNTQLACYALLYCVRFAETNASFTDVEVTIVQPRVNHPDGPVRTWKITAEYLRDFYDKVKAVIDGERSGELKAGDHCRWCPRAKNCPELYRLTTELAKADFAGIDEGITPEKASEVMGLETAVKTYFDAVKAWTKNQLDKGHEVPGYKLVNTYGNRAYAVSEDEVVRKCRSRKFGKKQIYKSVLLTPAQLEKVVGKELISSLVERPLRGTTVVPESDRRPAVVRDSIEHQFEGIESE